MGGVAGCPSCSQSPHDEAVVAQYAPERAASATPDKRDRPDQPSTLHTFPGFTARRALFLTNHINPKNLPPLALAPYT
jgi:hypothetical protein